MSKRLLAAVSFVVALVALAAIPCGGVDFVSPATGRLTVASIDGELTTPIGGVPIIRVYREGSDRSGLGANWSLAVALRMDGVDARHAVLSFGGQPIARFASGDGRTFTGDGGWHARRDGGRWQVRSPEDIASAFDANGREISRTDRNGNRIAFAYDAQGRVLRATTGAFRVDFQYDAKGRLKTLRDHASTGATYQYDTRDRLVDVVAVDGRRTRYGYTIDGLRQRADAAATRATDCAQRIAAAVAAGTAAATATPTCASDVDWEGE